MKPRLLIVAAGCLCALHTGCQHPDGHVEAQAAQAAITRTLMSVTAADEANARARIRVAGVDASLDRIDRKAVLLLNSK